MNDLDALPKFRLHARSELLIVMGERAALDGTVAQAGVGSCALNLGRGHELAIARIRGCGSAQSLSSHACARSLARAVSGLSVASASVGLPSCCCWRCCLPLSPCPFIVLCSGCCQVFTFLCCCVHVARADTVSVHDAAPVPREGGVPKVEFPVRPKTCVLSQRWRQG